MTTSTLTLTQSGLLFELLERHHRKAIQLARRRAHRKQLRAACWSILVSPRRALTASMPVDDSAEPALGTVPRRALESFTNPIAMSHPIHTYAELQKQIHDDLRIQHPEWVQSNGECPTCDSYEARLAQLLDNFTRTGSDDSIAAVHRALEQRPR
jgi:hypothetical protein